MEVDHSQHEVCLPKEYFPMPLDLSLSVCVCAGMKGTNSVLTLLGIFRLPVHFHTQCVYIYMYVCLCVALCTGYSARSGSQ